MKTYYIKIFGCQMNVSDAERIISYLEQSGFKKAPTIEGADLIVVVACSVRQTATDRIFGLKKKFKKLHAKKILTGCVLKSDKKKFEEFFDSVLSISQFLHGREKHGIDYFKINQKHWSSLSAFVPIMTGCNNFCSYCVVPYTRGREFSRPVKEIIAEIKNLIGNGYREITLLGQNVNSYQYNFAKLLQKINNLSGNFEIKFLTSHPKDMSDELIETIAKYKKISKEIHLPIQSGDDEILRKMNRGYNTDQYLNLIQKIRKKIPEAKISTDVIVGFPGETKNQFENTVKIFKEIKFNKAYINKYSARPGTIASKFKDDVPLEEKKRRWKILEKIVNLPRLIVVLGPTASGKSDYAVRLAKKINGEIVCADSRQIYKGMDIGTGKITKKQMQSIPHYCLDIASPKKQLTVVEYQKKALEAINKIYRRSKAPILCGGTGLYIQAVAEGTIVPQVEPDWKLRKELEKKSAEALFQQLKKFDPQRAKNIDAKNKRRLIRALEIIIKTNKPVPKIQSQPQFDISYIGIKKSPAELKNLINKRVDRMIKVGLEKEVRGLIKKYGWTKVLKNTIGYSSFAKASADKQRIINDIKLQTYQYAKRQMTWFKKIGSVNWI